MKVLKDPEFQLPLHALALQALREAVAQVIAEHKREGTPLAVWRDGQVVWISAEEAEAELASYRSES